MTIKTLTRRQYVLTAIAALLFLGVLYRYAPSTLSEEGVNIEEARQQISKYQGMAQKKEILQKKAATLDRQAARAENGLLKGSTVALAAVDLQNNLTDIADRNGVTISSLQVMRPPKNKKEDKPPYLEVPVRITMTISLRQLEKMLYNIAASRLLLRINEATIKVSGKEKDKLQTNLTICGLMAAKE